MKINKLSILAVLVFSLTISGARAGLAQLQPLQPQDPDWLVHMYEDGWYKVQEGVLQRGEGGAQVETFTYGEEGLRWTVARLEEQVSFLASRYNNHPDPDLANVIDRLHGDILAANARIDSGQVGEAFNGEQLNDCSIAYGAHAYADPLSGAQGPGVTARADAYWHTDCGFIGNAYAYAYVEGSYNGVFSTKTQEDPKYTSTWLDAAAQWSLTPINTSCYSRAYARAWSDSLNIGYSEEDINYSCPNPPPPLAITVSGPDSVLLTNSIPCKNVTWTASVSGGVPPYSTINWYLGTTYVGSGSSYTRNYCSTSQTVTAKATVSDSASQAAEGTKTTTITYFSGTTGGCSPGDCNCLNSEFTNPENSPNYISPIKEPCY
jgi:hypothetical protein